MENRSKTPINMDRAMASIKLLRNHYSIDKQNKQKILTEHLVWFTLERAKLSTHFHFFVFVLNENAEAAKAKYLPFIVGKSAPKLQIHTVRVAVDLHIVFHVELVMASRLLKS